MESTGKSNNGQGTTQPARGRRFSDEQKERAVELVRSKVLPRTAIAELIGATTESLRRWMKEAEAEQQRDRASEDDAGALGSAPAPAPAPTPGKSSKAPVTEPASRAPRSPYTPHDPAQGLGEHEVTAILELKRQHPSMGPAQIRAQLKRFKGWRVSNKAIARVLRERGYEPVHRGSRPQGPEPTRFEAPRRNALWQLDFAEVRVGAERLQLLVILDDFSRYVVGHALADAASSQVATETLRAAIARHGKPEAVRTDRGGAFVAFSKETDFGRFLEAELIDHIVGKSYNPKGGGKVESAIGTLRRELWDVTEFGDRRDAEQKVARFFERYNESRAHMGIDGLTPADRFFGRADRVLAAVDAVSRKRQGAAALLAAPGAGATAPLEELGSAETGAPLEVLRLVVLDGVMELRFCGARVRLGALET
jgi:transposase InsO family protein/transposase-like protein